jgi:Ca2+-binding RTX toxin-like protein
MRQRVLSGTIVTVAIALIGAAPEASAAPTASVAGFTVTVNGDSTGETFTIDQSGTDVHVHTPAGLTGSVAPCTITGGNDLKCPTASIFQVLVNGNAGEDTINDNRAIPTGNSDVLHGNAGKDTLRHASGAAADLFSSLLAGPASLFGDTEDDNLSFDGFVDTARGGADNDTLTATGAAGFTMASSGDEGNDILNGSNQRGDFFSADAGADTYNGGTYAARPGDINLSSPQFQSFHAADFMSYSASTGALDVSLDGQANDGPAGEGDNVGADIELVVGGAGADKLTAGSSSAILEGAAGEDVVTGGPGQDNLQGGAGNDQLTGADGNDTLQDDDPTPVLSDTDPPPGGNDKLDGGAGDDRLTVDRGADDVVGGPGTDTAAYTRYVTQKTTDTTQVKPVDFTISLDDTPNDGQTGANEGDNVHADVENVTTSEGNDSVTGSPAPNEITTGAGNDQVDPGAGADKVDLGVGDDTVNAVDQFTDTLRCGDGTDTASADLPGGQAVRADVLTDCETVNGTPFAALPDTARAKVTLSGGTIKSRAFLKNGTLTVSVACNEPCSAAGEAFTTGARLAKVGELSVGSGSLKLGKGKRTLKVKVAKRYLKSYRHKLRTRRQRRKGVKFSVAVVAKDAAGNVTNATRTVKVKG